MVNDGEIAVKVHTEYIQHSNSEEGNIKRVDNQASTESMQYLSAFDLHQRRIQQATDDVSNGHAADEVIVKCPKVGFSQQNCKTHTVVEQTS